MVRLVLRYSRSLRDGGRASGDIVLMDDQDRHPPAIDTFLRVEFSEMLMRYAIQAQRHPDAVCCYQRTDKPGFKIAEWAPAHVEQLRENPKEAVAELSAIRTVTYDMRSKKKEEE